MFQFSKEICLKNLAYQKLFNNYICGRNILITSKHFCQVQEIKEITNGEDFENSNKIKDSVYNKDRTKQIAVEMSMRYLKSLSYQETYKNFLVWEQYRRNHKGMYPPRKTRKMCIRAGQVATGNPCPICRDEYLVLDYRNLDLLSQFISKQTGEVVNYTKTGLCQKKHLELLVAVEKAMDYGLLTFNVPFREYDYSEYYAK